MIRYFTAGESHGPALSAIVEGLPSGITITPEDINTELARRQQGYGRGGRMKIETDKAVVLSGIRFGKTIGSPVALQIENRDWKNWTEKMAQFEKPNEDIPAISIPRPGHADLTGMIKYGFEDIRPVIERASARETAARVAACSLAKTFLRSVGIQIGSYVSSIGPAGETASSSRLESLLAEGAEALTKEADTSPVRMLEKTDEENAVAAIDKAKEEGDTLGGIIELFITGVPMGLGSYVQHDRRLDAELAAALISIQAVKGVEIGTAFDNARNPGSQVHDELFPGAAHGPSRKTNRAGGLEGSMTNGSVIHLRAAMKPIATLMSPLHSFDITSMEAHLSHIERSDTCAVPACSVIAEAVVAPVIANALLKKTGGDHLAEILERLEEYRAEIAAKFKQ
ncbi:MULTISPECIES: chorismate synthase [Prosthecochloris]|uniref:Chorismate synthase n=1 Tax=Prosthecochloris marina TaxID=2017681 RepID=A0A317T756_9CHLB|nr:MULTISPECIES: chorismate synthase [Prosthecochloris]PWW82080.1 chorismate synthase [Prosthecochloris marina]UZJ36763.1 chorismate synthase [Prosthecochloris sp. SCSIO W1103]UZJ39701.1 chorismate synthase [Prosthecochloris sp. SCSIO W1102]